MSLLVSRVGAHEPAPVPAAAFSSIHCVPDAERVWRPVRGMKQPEPSACARLLACFSGKAARQPLVRPNHPKLPNARWLQGVLRWALDQESAGPRAVSAEETTQRWAVLHALEDSYDETTGFSAPVAFERYPALTSLPALNIAGDQVVEGLPNLGALTAPVRVRGSLTLRNLPIRELDNVMTVEGAFEVASCHGLQRIGTVWRVTGDILFRDLPSLTEERFEPTCGWAPTVSAVRDNGIPGRLGRLTHVSCGVFGTSL